MAVICRWQAGRRADGKTRMSLGPLPAHQVGLQVGARL